MRDCFLSLPCQINLSYRTFLFERKSCKHRGKDTEVFQLPIHFPNGPKSKGRTGLKPGARSFIRYSHIGAGAQAHPGASAGSCVWSGAAGMPATQVMALPVHHSASSSVVCDLFFTHGEPHRVYLCDTSFTLTAWRCCSRRRHTGSRGTLAFTVALFPITQIYYLLLLNDICAFKVAGEKSAFSQV